MEEAKKVICITDAPTTNIEPKTDFTELGYKNDITIEAIESMTSISKDIITDVDEVIKNFNALKEKYEVFTDFDESINQATSNLKNSANEIESKVKAILSLMTTIVNNLAVADENLYDDLDRLNKLLTDEQTSEEQTLGTSSQQSSATVGQGGESSTTQNTEQTSQETNGEMTKTTGAVQAQTAASGPNEQTVQTLTQEASPNLTPEQNTETVQGSVVSEAPPATPEPPQAPAEQAPAPTGNVSGTLSPGTTETTFQAQPYNLPPDEYKELCATVYAEASENPAYISSDSMGVTSVILNRADAGSSVQSVISAQGQFSGYGSQNAKFSAAMNDPSVIPPEMRAAIDRALAGERNTTGHSFSGNGVHNSFR